MTDFDWPHKPTLTYQDDPGHRSLAADYELAEAKADFWPDLAFFLFIGLGSFAYVAVFVLGIWKLLDLLGVSL